MLLDICKDREACSLVVPMQGVEAGNLSRTMEVALIREERGFVKESLHVSAKYEQWEKVEHL